MSKVLLVLVTAFVVMAWTDARNEKSKLEVGCDKTVAAECNNIARSVEAAHFDVTANKRLRLNIHLGVCPSYPTALGCSLENSDDIYWADGEIDTLYHEIGHQFDRQFLTDEDRQTFATIIGRPSYPWTHNNGELFADAFMTCALAGPNKPDRMFSFYGYDPDERTYRKVCRRIMEISQG